MKKYSKLLVANIILLFIVSSCQKETKDLPAEEIPGSSPQSKQPLEPGFAENDMVMFWNEKTATVLSSGMQQPRRARLFAITQIAVHDALNAIKPKYQRYALLNTREQFANPDAAVASAAYWVIKGLNIQGSFPVDTWYDQSLSTMPDGESKELGKTLGKQSADAIIANRANDGLSQVINSSSVPADGDDPGKYRVTLPFSNPVLNLSHNKNIPNWGIVLKPFAVASNDQFRPGGPYSVNSEAYTLDYNEIKTKGARVNHTRTTEESEIAFFWSDNRPSLIWNTLVRNVISTKKMDAWKTARLLALIHTAVADGFNSVLEAKYHFYYWRPETAIRLGDNDGNPNTAGDANWLPSIIEIPNPNPLMIAYTPPIPEYPSGYAMIGGATAEILKLFFGPDELSFDVTSNATSVTRHYTSFSQAATENSISKIYGGFYFRRAVMDGEEMGKQIATYVFNNSFKEE
ncbi:MAG TPA: vanadium-dependent haloperoxidase [Chitinophagaceae bacterium]|jgi:hypothetical protein|nr:vanadium-dependent haloperoxidase [Chitinophagaceae bacterium]